MSRALEVVYQAARKGARVIAQHHGKVDISCVAGCGLCCYSTILGSAGDGLRIYRYLQSQGRWNDGQREFLARDDEFLTHTHPDEVRGKHPCPFLIDGNCSIRPVRPAGCAITFSFGAPQDCLPKHQIFDVMPRDSVTAPLWKELIEAERRVFAPNLILTLPGAVLLAASRVECRPEPNVFRTERRAGEANPARRFFEEAKKRHG